MLNPTSTNAAIADQLEHAHGKLRFLQEMVAGWGVDELSLTLCARQGFAEILADVAHKVEQVVEDLMEEGRQ